MRKILLLLVPVLIITGFYFLDRRGGSIINTVSFDSSEDAGGPETKPHPLAIQALREGDYPGSELVIEQILSRGSNYSRYVASYRSEGLKIYGLLTVPSSDPPQSGYPAIIFNHGYIPPDVYRTTERYASYQDAFARAGYVTFKSDYRGHGNSEGVARGSYSTNDYTIDVLNALASIEKYSGVDPEKIGMWGHSMGGHITLESMVVNKGIKAGVIWAGVVGSYEDIFERWRSRREARGEPSPSPGSRGWWRYELSQEYGEPSVNPDFWRSLSATAYIDDISGPVQIHHGTADSSVDVSLSQNLHDLLVQHGLSSELFLYSGDDHNISNNLNLALSRSVEFFDRYLK